MASSMVRVESCGDTQQYMCALCGNYFDHIIGGWACVWARGNIGVCSHCDGGLGSRLKADATKEPKPPTISPDYRPEDFPGFEWILELLEEGWDGDPEETLFTPPPGTV